MSDEPDAAGEAEATEAHDALADHIVSSAGPESEVAPARPPARGRPPQPALDLGETGPRHMLIDVQALIGLVAKRHNLLLKADDPAFVLVTIFEEVSRRHMAAMSDELNRSLDALTASAEEQKEASRQIAGRIINEGGDFIAEKIRDAGTTMGPEIAKGVLAELGPTLQAIVGHTVSADHARKAARFAAAVSILGCVITVGFVMVRG